MTNEKSKNSENMIKYLAIKSGEMYFDDVIWSLKKAVGDAMKARREWRLAIKDKPYADGRKRDPRQKVTEIENLSFNLSNNLNLHHDMAIKTVKIVTQAFKVEL